MELEQYKQALAAGIQQILDSGAFDAVGGYLGEVRNAVGGLGSYSDRALGSLERMDLADERTALQALVGAIDAAGDDPWPLGNVLVGVSNFAIGIQNMARSSPYRDLAHLVGSLRHFGAVQLAAQIGEPVYNALLNMWQAHSYGQWLGQAANEVLAIDRPEGVEANVSPSDDEHAECMTEIEAAMNDLGAIAPADGRDHSAHLAGQIGIPFEGSDDTAQQGGAHGGGAAWERYDWNDIPWAALTDANQRAGKAAGSDDRLPYIATGGVILIGDAGQHDDVLYEAVRTHPGKYEGTARFKSARIGAGTIEVTGCPDDQQANFERHLNEFSRKDVNFL